MALSNRLNKLTQEAALTVVRYFSLPLRILLKGHLFYLAYCVVALGGGYLVLHQLQVMTHNYVLLIGEDQLLAPKNVKQLDAIAWTLIWSLSAPLVLMTLVLPVRIFYFYNSTPLWPLLKATPIGFRLSVQSILVALRRTLYIIVPLVALVALYHLFIERVESRAALQIFLVSCGAVLISVFNRAIPALCIPILSVLALYEARYAAYICQAVIGVFKFHILGIAIGGILVAIAGLTYLPFRLFLLLVGFVTWFSVITICDIVAQRIYAFEMAQRTPEVGRQN